MRPFQLLLSIAALHMGFPVCSRAAELNITVLGGPVTVFSKARDACDPVDIPDAPARAIRLADGTVQLYATHFHNRRLTGRSLLALSNDCRVVFEGGERDDPAAFDDRAWIASLYTPDGRTVFAAVHNEFQGHRRPALCSTGAYLDCWYNAVTAAVSQDGGQHFGRVSANNGLIAALPYQYYQVKGHHTGYFNPSNIVGYNGALFMMIFTTEARAQKPGNCLLRSERIADPAAWRAWDGRAFDMRFVDPYASADPPDQHVCSPVGGPQLRWPVTSLVRHAPSGLFIALMMNGAADGGVFYAASPDLIAWTGPVKLMDGTGEGAYQCGGPSPVTYPSLLDPDSPDRNFMTVGPTAELFLTQFVIASCRTSMDRDLIRLPVRLSIKAK